MQPSDGEIQRRARSYANPLWGYRRGDDGGIDKDLFDGELPVGWYDSPAKVTTFAASQPLKVGDRVTVGAEALEVIATIPLAPPYDAHNANVIKAEIKRRTGKGVKPGTTKAQMAAMLADLDAAAQA